MAIENMVKTNTPLGELTSIVYTVVWSTKRLNLSVIGKFDQLIKYYFDPKIYQNVETSTLVDLEVSFIQILKIKKDEIVVCKFTTYSKTNQ